MSELTDRLFKTEERPGDYTGEDGLRHCGVCHEAKEEYFEDRRVICGHDRHPRNCACVRAVLEKEEREEKEKKHRARVGELRRECFDSEGLKKLHFDESGEPHSDAEKVCRRYAEHFEEAEKRHCGLLLWGISGTGKTATASCIANTLIEREIGVIMTRPSTLCNKTMGEIGEYLKKLSECRLLIIDDFGAERSTGLALERLYDAVDCRRREGRPLIVTTDLGVKQMKAEENPALRRVYRRILGQTLAVKFTGEGVPDEMHSENEKWLGELIQ